jgi:predicted transcriptional regulator
VDHESLVLRSLGTGDDVARGIPRRSLAITARELREGIASFRPLSHSSVSTLVSRLRERGLVERTPRRIGKAHVYRCTRRGRRMAQPLLQRLVRRVFAGDAVALVASLFDGKPPTARELDELEHLVADLRSRRRRTS